MRFKILEPEDMFITTIEIPGLGNTPGSLESQIEIIIICAGHGLLVIRHIVIPGAEERDDAALPDTHADIGAEF